MTITDAHGRLVFGLAAGAFLLSAIACGLAFAAWREARRTPAQLEQISAELRGLDADFQAMAEQAGVGGRDGAGGDQAR